MNSVLPKRILYALLGMRVFQYEVYFEDIQTLEITREITCASKVVLTLYRQIMANRGWQSSFLTDSENGRFRLTCWIRIERFSECSR